MTVEFDWRSWRHDPVTGTVHGITGLAAAATVAGLPGVPDSPELVVAGGFTVAGVAVLRAKPPHGTWPVAIYRATMALSGSVWFAAVTSSGWSVTAAWTLAAGAAAAGGLAKPVRWWGRRAEAARAETARLHAERVADEMEQEQLLGLAEQWEERIERVCSIRVETQEITYWQFPGPNGEDRTTGYTLQVVLPTTGVTVNRLRDHQDGLATAARLPLGCGVEILPGLDRGIALVDVSTYDALQDSITLPPATSPRSIADDLDIGIRRNGAPAQIKLLHEAGALVGETGSGKSNELLVVLARYLECKDTLPLVIDHNGAALALPWLALWAEGQISKPPILWASDNDDESLLMCQWLIEAIATRKRVYHQANRRRNDDKIKPTPQVPHLLLIVDEFASLPPRVQDAIIQISNRGRAAAVRTLVCGLRGTADSLPTVLTKQARTKIAMQCADDEELRYYFAKSAGKLSAQDAPHPGYGFLAVDKDPAIVFKGYRMLPTTIEEVALRTDAWRPDLDQATAEMPDGWQEVYEGRWERSRHLVAAAVGSDDPGPTAAVGGPPASPSAGSGAGSSGQGGASRGYARPTTPRPPLPEDSGDGSGGGGFAGIGDRMAEAVERLRDAMNEAPAPRDGGGDDDAEFERIVAGLPVLPDLIALILAAFGERPRMHTEDLARQIGARPETLGQLLSKLDVRPMPNAFAVAPAGPRRRGYRRADVEAAASRIRRGEAVPAEVAAWRPELPPELPPAAG